MSDVKCSCCGEPWDIYHLRHDLVWELLDAGLSEEDIKRFKGDLKDFEFEEPAPPKYRRGVFFQGEEADPFLAILDNKGEKAAMDAFSDYDPEPELVDHKPWGDGDHTFEKDNWVLSWNLRLGYIGISQVVPQPATKRTIKWREEFKKIDWVFGLTVYNVKHCSACRPEDKIDASVDVAKSAIEETLAGDEDGIATELSEFDERRLRG